MDTRSGQASVNLTDGNGNVEYELIITAGTTGVWLDWYERDGDPLDGMVDQVYLRWPEARQVARVMLSMSEGRE